MKKSIYIILILTIVIIGFFALAAYMSREKPVDTLDSNNTNQNQINNQDEDQEKEQSFSEISSTTLKDTPQDTPNIKGITWIWEKTEMANGTVVTPIKLGMYSVLFEHDGTVTGKTSCNGFGGDYTLGSGGSMSFGPFMSTLMYCEGSQEAEFSQAVTNSNRYTINAEGKLVFTIKDGGKIILKK